MPLPDMRTGLMALYVGIGIPTNNSNSMRLALGPASGNLINDTVSDSLICISGADSLAPNIILAPSAGTSILRGIWGGYDNVVDAAIATNIFGSHHSVIEAGSGGHSAIFGGGGHRVLGGTTAFACVVGGQEATAAGSSAVCIGAEFSNSVGVRTAVIASTKSSIGMRLGTGVATTSVIPNPVKGSVLTLSSTASFGTVGATDVLVAMDSVSTPGGVFKVPFTVTITSSTQLTITSPSPTQSYFNRPSITNGALVYPLTQLASNGAHEVILASSNSHIQCDTNANGNVIIGGLNSYIQNGTNNANGTLYPSWCLNVGSNNVSQGPGQFVYGVGGRPLNSGQVVRSYGFFVSAGDRQVSQFFSGTTTTDGTAQQTFIPYADTGVIGQNYLLAPSKAYLIEALVLGIQTAGTGGAGGNVASYRVVATLTTTAAGAITIKSQSTTVLQEDQAAWDITLVKFDAASLGGAYATNNQGIIRFSCTGDASRTVRWLVDAKVVELGYL